ncbi:MAG TPA: aspartate carbamoyltransferase catalytic subunit, partial [Myxococcaceae bacterium]|nr:aspartate carbamoyltransferase catalytic subunit [Myxococcaceae bacterium]
MSRHDIELLFGRARLHARGLRAGTPLRSLAGRVVANLFFENSTRTRLSFERAAKALGADVLNFNASTSSVSKGESLVDTVRNVEALGASIIVLRHPASGAADLVSRHVRCSVVNAGDGTHAHPSQALLDAFTLHERWGTLEGKTVAIVGDVLHSRVARSNLYCLTTLGARVVVAGPPTLVPVGLEALGAQVLPSIDAALEEADAVMMLRVQLERQRESMFPTSGEYAMAFGLTLGRARSLKPDAVVMHPGPVNRGVELAPEVADGPANVILEQVANGVAVRMA